MNDVLLIFSRFPRLGKVKTRLSPALSPRQALSLHNAFLLDTLERTSRVKARRHLFLADCLAEEAREWATRAPEAADVAVHLQSGDDLGARMWNAYREAAGGAHPAVLIGTDSPTLPVSYIEEAFGSLRHNPVTIGPAEDGGYYLLGLAKPLRRLFFGIDWGGGQVLRQTLDRLGEAGCRMLPAWRDVDTPADLVRLKRELVDGVEDAPRRTARILRTLDASQ